MKRMNFKVIALVALGLSLSSFASGEHQHELCEGFVPANTMQIPVGTQRRMSVRMMDGTTPAPQGGLTQEQFNKVIDRAERLYGPVIAKAGGTLKVNRKWDDPTVNASAQQMGTQWIVNMYGGLARHSAITEEGFALVVCHEIGHHIGGAPRKVGWFGVDWATNEGGSDYFATGKCLRNYFAEDDNESITSAANIDPLATERCATEFSDHADQMVCLRNSMAATSVAYLFMDLRKETTFPKFNTPDAKIVGRTDDNHPGTQCRLDTYFAGAICHVSKDIANSNTDYREGSCITPNDTYGSRPLCWFKPD